MCTGYQQWDCSQLWENAGFFFVVLMLNCIFNLFYNKTEFYVCTCYNNKIFTMQIILHEKAYIHLTILKDSQPHKYTNIAWNTIFQVKMPTH